MDDGVHRYITIICTTCTVSSDLVFGKYCTPYQVVLEYDVLYYHATPSTVQFIMLLGAYSDTGTCGKFGRLCVGDFSGIVGHCDQSLGRICDPFFFGDAHFKGTISFGENKGSIEDPELVTDDAGVVGIVVQSIPTFRANVAVRFVVRRLRR